MSFILFLGPIAVEWMYEDKLLVNVIDMYNVVPRRGIPSKPWGRHPLISMDDPLASYFGLRPSPHGNAEPGSCSSFLFERVLKR